MQKKIFLGLIIFLNLRSADYNNESIGFYNIRNFSKEVDPKYTAYSIPLLKNSTKFILHATYFIKKQKIVCHISSDNIFYAVDNNYFDILQRYFKLLEKNLQNDDKIFEELFEILNKLYTKITTMNPEKYKNQDSFCEIL